MFISSYEKSKLFSKLEQALKDLSTVSTEITMLKAKVKVLEAKAKVVVPKKVKTPEQKAMQAEYMRRYKAKKKAEKSAQIAKAVA